MKRVTIFYNYQQWVNDEPACFDYRIDTQIIPSGSVVCGLIVGDRELLDPPAATDKQQVNYLSVLQAARQYVTEGITID